MFIDDSLITDIKKINCNPADYEVTKGKVANVIQF